MRDTTRPGAGLGPYLLAPATILMTLVLAPAVGQPAAAQSSERPIIRIAPAIVAEPATQVAFPIQVGYAPPNSFVRVQGLPAMAALSDGYSIAPGSWAVPLRALPSLEVTLPAAVAGTANVVATLVGRDGSVLSQARSSLLIASANSKRPAAKGAVPALTAPDHERALQLVEKGNRQLSEGLVAQARVLYERAADLGLAQGALALAATYDPAELDRMRVRNIQPDAKEAKRWYERARALGAPDARAPLRRLGEN